MPNFILVLYPTVGINAALGYAATNVLRTFEASFLLIIRARVLKGGRRIGLCFPDNHDNDDGNLHISVNRNNGDSIIAVCPHQPHHTRVVTRLWLLIFLCNPRGVSNVIGVHVHDRGTWRLVVASCLSIVSKFCHCAENSVSTLASVNR